MATARGHHLIGKVLGSCFIEKLLGYGGSSAVFLAQETTTGEQVAIKVFLPHSYMNAQMQKDFYSRFLREAEAVSKLDHPNILPIYAYGEQDGLPYIIMPYMEGGTLSECIGRQGCLSLDDACWYLEQIASALDYAHQEYGYVHCDVKPANILLDGEGNAMLTDFGIIHMMHPESTTGSSQHKPPQMLMGTPVYISPEQALGQPLDGRSDIYSLGITLFYLLTGRLPFEADSTIAVALLQIHEAPPALGQLRADISPAIDNVVQKALAKRPEERFQTAGEFSEAFTQAVALQSTSNSSQAVLAAKPVVRVKPASQRSFSFPRAITAIILLLILTTGAAIAGGLISSHFANSAPKVPLHVQITVPAHALGDDLADNQDWPTGGTFFFSGDQYHIQNKFPRNVALALYADHEYTNFRLAVTMSEIHGSGDGADYYGVAFRGAVDQSRYYLFEVTAWAAGQYQFLRYDGDGHWDILAIGNAPSLVTNLGKSNTITVIAKGNIFSFLINGTSAGSPVTDASKLALSTGEVGLSVEEQGTEIVFSLLHINTPV
jgi:serine/threonine protein kinase